MSTNLLIPLLALGVAGCTSLGPFELSSPYWLPPVGSEVALKQALEVPPQSARVFLQQGRVVAKSGVNQFLPNCNFEVSQVFEDSSQTIQPDTFRVRRVGRQSEEVVQRAPAQYAALYLARGGMDGGTSPIIHAVHLWLESAKQPQVRRLSCRGAVDDPPKAKPPTGEEIFQALGDIVVLRVPD